MTITPTGTPIDIHGSYVPDEVVVKFIEGTKQSEIQSIIDSLNIKSGEIIPELDVWLLKVAEGEVPSILAALGSQKAVLFAEPNYIARAFTSPNDPEWKTQESYLQNIQMPQAWDLPAGQVDAMIAVIDTGIDASHPELASKIWINPGELGEDGTGRNKNSNGKDDDNNGYIDDWQGWNAISNNGDIHDSNGHGTHIAGIAIASANNNLGIAGIAWGSHVMVLKALDDSGEGGYAQVAKAIIYAASQGASVINLSLGNSSYSTLLDMAVEHAGKSGLTIIAAAGDVGAPLANYPAAFSEVISVGAVDEKNHITKFSPFGDAVDIFAPGSDIDSTWPGGGYKTQSGTSQAAAHVSGVAAMLASMPDFRSPRQIREALLSTTAPIGSEGKGPGLLQAYSALIFGAAPVTATPTPTPTISPGKALMMYPLVPTPAITPPGPTSTPRTADPHVAYNTSTDSCAGCHRGHTASGLVVRMSWPEEQVCFTCHTAGGSGTNIQPAFASYTNTATRIFKHDIYAVNGVHSLSEGAGGSFGGANRHVECEDCHEPHDATRGSTYPPALQAEMYAVPGVDPQWVGGGPPVSYSWMSQAERENQVCFKCHSGFTALPAYQPDGWNGSAYVTNGLFKLDNSSTRQKPDYRDLAIEFNPNNASFHPVVAQGRNQSIPPGSFVNGWSQTSLTYCSDCHNNASSATQGVGPHGSPSLHILDQSSNYTTVDNNIRPASGEICFKCHNYSTYVSNGTASNTLFRRGSDNLHTKHTDGERVPCYVCHDTHGSEQLHLINFDTSRVTISGTNRDSQNAWEFVGNTRTCYLACHGKSHGSSESYTP